MLLWCKRTWFLSKVFSIGRLLSLRGNKPLSELYLKRQKRVQPREPQLEFASDSLGGGHGREQGEFQKKPKKSPAALRGKLTKF